MSENPFSFEPLDVQPDARHNAQAVPATETPEAAQPTEDTVEKTKAWLADLVSYGVKANENIVAVNEVGGSIKYPGVKLSIFKEKLGALNSMTAGLQPETALDVSTQCKILMSQSLATGYDPELVQRSLDRLKEISSAL